MSNSEEFDYVIAAIEASGRPMNIRNGELNTRCPFCGDSRKNAYHKHFYLNCSYPHKAFCQRCGYRSSAITLEIAEALGAHMSSDAVVYIRQLEKNERRKSKSRRNSAPTLSVASERMIIPLPDKNSKYDMEALGYLEGRLDGKLDDREISRYKIITGGLYGFLEANNIEHCTVHQREGDRINDTCIGFLTTDESYVIFRTMDDEFVKSGGRRYTNYRIHPDWEGSKSFTARHDVNMLLPKHKVVCTEGIIDLIQVEREFYKEERWKDDFVGVATCGAAHTTILRQLLTLGVINQDLELYIDNKSDGSLDTELVAGARKIKRSSPFFSTPFFKMNVYRNGMPGEKDFGVSPTRHKRVQVKL